MFCLLHRYMENAFSWWLRSVTAEHLRNYAELAEDPGWTADRLLA